MIVGSVDGIAEPARRDVCVVRSVGERHDPLCDAGGRVWTALVDADFGEDKVRDGLQACAFCPTFLELVILTIQQSPDGKRVALSTESGQIYVFDLESGSLATTFTSHAMSVRDIVWSPDGNVSRPHSIAQFQSPLTCFNLALIERVRRQTPRPARRPRQRRNYRHIHRTLLLGPQR